MDGGTIAVIILVVVNIAAVAVGYGRVSQKVSDLCQRMERVEKAINNPGKKEKDK